MESILTSIKKPLNISEECGDFDVDIIMHINSVLMTLRQIGVGPSTGFVIKSDEETWEKFLGKNVDYEEVKTYIYLRVRLLFDPPSNSSVLESIKEQIKEFEWRLNVQAESEV